MEHSLKNFFFTLWSFTALIVLLGGSSCNETQKAKPEIKKNKNKKKKTLNNEKKEQKKEKLTLDQDEDVDSIAFLDELSSQKASDIETEIKRLIAMLEKEESLSQQQKNTEAYQTILFHQASEYLDQQQKESIAQIAKKVARSAAHGKKIILRGHSDLLETNENESQKLAERRALAVKDELIKLNIPAEKIQVTSVGVNEPIVFGFDRDHQELENQANRRVEILTT